MVSKDVENQEFYPQAYGFQYQPDEKKVVIDYLLPSLEEIRATTVYVPGPFAGPASNSSLSTKELEHLCKNFISPTAKKKIHEIFAADKTDAVTTVVFNVFLLVKEPGTDKENYRCVASMESGKDELSEFQIHRILPNSRLKDQKSVRESLFQVIHPSRHDSY